MKKFKLFFCMVLVVCFLSVAKAQDVLHSEKNHLPVITHVYAEDYTIKGYRFWVAEELVIFDDKGNVAFMIPDMAEEVFLLSDRETVVFVKEESASIDFMAFCEGRFIDIYHKETLIKSFALKDFYASFAEYRFLKESGTTCQISFSALESTKLHVNIGERYKYKIELKKGIHIKSVKGKRKSLFKTGASSIQNTSITKNAFQELLLKLNQRWTLTNVVYVPKEQGGNEIMATRFDLVIDTNYFSCYLKGAVADLSFQQRVLDELEKIASRLRKAKLRRLAIEVYLYSEEEGLEIFPFPKEDINEEALDYLQNKVYGRYQKNQIYKDKPMLIKVVGEVEREDLYE